MTDVTTRPDLLVLFRVIEIARALNPNEPFALSVEWPKDTSVEYAHRLLRSWTMAYARTVNTTYEEAKGRALEAFEAYQTALGRVVADWHEPHNQSSQEIFVELCAHYGILPEVAEQEAANAHQQACAMPTCLRQGT